MTDELARISRRLRLSPIAEGGYVSLSHDRFDRDTKSLDPSLRDEVCGLMAQLRAAIPTDFSFSVVFEFAGIRVATGFEDGNTGGMGGLGGSGFFTSRRSMLKKLRATKWDQIRADVIEQSTVFEDMVRDADDRPPNIPSSEQAAKRWASEIRHAIDDVRTTQPVPEFTVVAVQDEGAGFEVSHFKTRREVVCTLADQLTCRYDILAILESGLEWSFADIEAAQLEAVEQLGPISRAKAEGRL